MDERARLRVRADRRRAPERPTQVDGAELVRIDVRVDRGVAARAVVRELAEVVPADLREVPEHGAVARVVVRAEPRRIAGGAAAVGVRLEVRRRGRGVELRGGGGDGQCELLVVRAPVER